MKSFKDCDMKKHIPNLITSMNVISGTMAIFMAMYGHLLLAAGCILLGMIFDFFDGMTARLLNVKSDIGKELDSLADVVSFGVAPAVLAHFLMLKTLPGESMAHFLEWTLWEQIMVCTPLLIPAFSAYRLAKFNLDTRQATSFIGMPTPANALFWTGLTFGCFYSPALYSLLFANVATLGICAVILSILLISELPMFSLKISGFGWQENRVRYCYLLSLVVCVCIWGAAVVFLVVPLYILFSLFSLLIKSKSSIGL